mmetsp:Transcript_101522/g.201648  ORF Transcript_101522/g.201648 Transcript_101522/m.201648 type:complete len:345 (+) Transcript_101522:82-1116(+)
MSVSDDSEEDSSVLNAPSEDPLDRDYEELDPDTYGMGITAIVKDSYWLVHGRGNRPARTLQFISAMTLIAFTIFLQGYFIWELQNLVSSVAVTRARHIYGEYELNMYEEGHLYNNSAGHPRGEGGVNGPYFNEANFKGLSTDFKTKICSIPFSQPGFFSAVLLIWTLTVMNSLKRTAELMYHFLWLTPTCSGLKQMLKPGEENTTIVRRLTCPVKFAIFGLIGVPRTVMNIILLWRGTRYLAATFSFADLLLNAIALEFILLLKDLLWMVVISDRNKREVANLRYVAQTRLGKVSGMNYVASWSWLVLSMAYVGLYFRFQQTMPDYNWDVKDVCKKHLEWLSRG